MDFTSRELKNFRFDLWHLIEREFHRFAKVNPQQMNEPDEGWEHWATIYHFSRPANLTSQKIVEFLKEKGIINELPEQPKDS